MKGYSKIKLVNSSSSKSRSIDFSDQTLNTTTPRIQKPTSNNKPSSIQYEDDDDDYKHYSHSDNQQAAQQADYLPNQKLTSKNQLAVAPNGSTTLTDTSKDSSNRFKIEKQNSTGRALMQSAVIRAMSIRRSSSVSSERYSRIHDQYANTFDVDYGRHEEQQQEEEEDLKYARSKNNMKKHKRGSILKACKRIFGL